MEDPGPGGPVARHTVRMATPRARSAGSVDPVRAGSGQAASPRGTAEPGPGQRAGRPEELPPALSAALAGFCRHLDAERALSRHTVRAYHGDIQSLLEYARRYGIDEPGLLDVSTLRGWL